MAAEYTSITYESLEELDDEHTFGCKCCRFSKGSDLPIPKALTVEETKRAARHFSTSVFKDWTQLHAVVKRYEATIQKRWMKKSIRQRRDVLVKAWPVMSSIAATHRPDFEELRSPNKRAPRSRISRSEAFLWPYINLEDLQYHNLLLLFINSRGRHLPDTFRIADVKAAHLGDGWHQRLLTFGDDLESYCCEDHYVADHDRGDDVCLLFQEKHSPTRYGRIITGHTQSLKPEQFKFLRRQAEGLLSLEIQQGIYRFVLAAVKLILHDIPQEVRCFLAPCQPEPTMLGMPGPGEYLSSSTHSREAPYRVPQQLDLKRLKLLVMGRRDSAEDHVWLLREDPFYFFDSLQEWAEHLPGNDDKSCDRPDRWHRAAGPMVTNAFEVYVFWDDTYKKLKAMPDIDVQLSRADGGRVRLSPQDEDRWAALIDVVWHLMYALITHLGDGICASPRLRSRFMFNQQRGGSWRWSVKEGAPEAVKRITALWSAISYETSQELHGLAGLVQEFQYMLETDPQAAQYIDPWIAAHFSDVALCSEIITAVDSLAPWFDENKAAMIATRHSSEKQNDKIRTLQLKLYIGIKNAVFDGLAFAPSKKGQFDYPIEKRRTKSNVDQMCFAEKNLDVFWHSVEKGVIHYTSISLEKVLKNRLSFPWEMTRTKPWVEPTQLPTPAASPNESEREPLCVPIELGGNVLGGHPDSPTTKKDFVKTNAKDKVKTRGKPAGQDTRLAMTPAPVPPAAPVREHVEKVKISKRAYKVFTLLLPSLTAAQQPRSEVAWDDLLYAMNAIGLQPTKLYGSVWMFRPVPKGESHSKKEGVVTVGKMDMERSIQFHEPKEVRRGQKIPKPMVRTFGRRLKHAFGWEEAEELFECD